MEKKTVKREELARRLREDVYLRELRAGDRVGSVRRLAMRYHVTPLTISRMLSEMVECKFLYRDEKGWFKLLNDPPRRPRIGYAGEPMLPGGGNDCLMADARKKLFRELEKLDAMPQIIGYHELLDPAVAKRRLEHINGLLVMDSFVDDVTSSVLRELDMPIVRIGQVFPQDTALQTSEVVQFYDPVLEEFADYCDLKSYRRAIIFHETHRNGVLLAGKIRSFLQERSPDTQIEMIVPKSAEWTVPEMKAFCCIQEFPPQTWNDTLIVSISGYFARGICRALKQRGERADILSVDNLDGYEKCSFFDEPYLTAIDRNMGRIFRDAVRLLYDQIRSGDERKVIIKVPAKLVIRRSITHINQDWKEDGAR